MSYKYCVTFFCLFVLMQHNTLLFAQKTNTVYNTSADSILHKATKSNEIVFHAFNAVKVSIEPRFFHNSAIIFLILFLFCLVFFVFLFLWSKYKKRRNREIQKIIDDRTHIINLEKTILQKQTDSLKVKNFEVKTQNSELRTESQQLKETNEMILQQNKMIEEQSQKIHKKNELLTQSLNYARRIQHSLFPNITDIKKVLPKSSLFFQPKDIVSGDFYWMHSYVDLIIIAEVDCTGHGVPGAFMSMIGNTLLNEIVINKQIHSPQEIFKKLNEELLFIFSHDDFDDEAQDEGMDLTLAVVNTKTKKIQIASAMQNFFIIKNNEVNIYRGDIFSIGGLISRLKKPVYTTHDFDITDGLRVIMSSDGFVDQFGGTEKDKFGVDRFYKLLSDTSTLSVDDQITEVKSHFSKWKSSQDQMDDILIIGFEF